MVFTAPFWGCLEGNTDQSASWRVRTPARQIAFELHPTRVVGDTAPLPSADPSSAGTYGDTDGMLHAVSGVVDAGHVVYVLDASFRKIVAFGPQGEARVVAAGVGNGPGEFENPTDLSLGPDGRLYVLDPGNARISVFNADGGLHGDFPVDRPLLSIVATDDGVVGSKVIRSGRHALFKYSLAGEPVDSFVEVEPRWRAAAADGASGMIGTSWNGRPFYLAPIPGTVGELSGEVAAFVEYPRLRSVEVGEGRSSLDFFPVSVHTGRRYRDGQMIITYYDAKPDALANGELQVKMFVDVFQGEVYSGSAVLEEPNAVLKYSWLAPDRPALWVQVNSPHPRVQRYELRSKNPE